LVKTSVGPVSKVLILVPCHTSEWMCTGLQSWSWFRLKNETCMSSIISLPF